MIDLDLLRAFLAVFRHGSVTKAAKDLAISQSTMSSRLQTLEQSVGKTLFEKRGRGIRATQNGEALARSIASHIDNLEAISEAFRHRSTSLRGPIRIAAGNEFIEHFLASKVGVLMQLGVRPEFIQGPADGRVNALLDGLCDFAILTTSTRHPGISTALIHREHFVLVAAPRWAEILRDDADGSIARGELPMLTYAHSLPIIRRYWSEVFGREPMFEAAAVLPDLRSLVRAAVSGAGATVVPDYLCQDELRMGKLIQDRPVVSSPVNQIELAWKRGGQDRPRISVVRDLLLKKTIQ